MLMKNISIFLSIIAIIGIFGTSEVFGEIQIDEKYYYDLGDSMIINGELIGYDEFLFKENSLQQEPIKIDIYNTQSPEQIFNIAIFPDCANGSYPDCDYIFENSLSLSREVGFTDSIYNVIVSYGSDTTSYEFGIENYAIQALKSINFENVDGDKIEVVLDKDGYKPGDTVDITALTNFGFKSILTVEIGQLDSPVFDPTRYGSTERRLDYNQYDSTFSYQYKLEDMDKRLGHYFVTVFDNLDSTTKYFKVSESGLEIIPDEPTLTFTKQILEYDKILGYDNTLYFSGYMDNTLDTRYDLSQGTFGTAKNNSENKRLLGNNVRLVFDYDSDVGFKKIDPIYINMNELGYFEGTVPITRILPSDQIITVTAETISYSASEWFFILGDPIYIKYY